MRKLGVIILAIFSMSFTLASSFKIRVHNEYGVTVVEIVSLSDDISIKNATANRGNCLLLRTNAGIVEEFKKGVPNFGNSVMGAMVNKNTDAFPVNMKFGDQGYFHFRGCNNLLELTIDTNKGSETYNFQ